MRGMMAARAPRRPGTLSVVWTVDPATAKYSETHDGVRYFFCSAGCQTKFKADPGKYLKADAPAPKPAAQKGVIYTCPMHPEIRQDGPGSCPICGMALEPAGGHGRDRSKP